MSIKIRPIKEVEERLASLRQPQWRWYHGLAFYAIVQVLTFSTSALVSVAVGNKGKNLRETVFGDTSYFRHLKQAKIAPPSWFFAPAWTINNLSVIAGTLHVLNLPRETRGRNAYLALQAATWLDFIAFNAAYFSLRSPINAFVLTVLFFLLTLASGFVAIFRLKDTRVALSLATLFIWLIVATTAATAQMLWNKDELYEVGPFVKPDPRLVKESVR
ncbi:tryptophan-rich sensory protein [Tengunoibacter tsumagoiensis]|uniref:Tryptophan-rich sensory protein n=1 Tax=Tengunoibacter tsumagoiensis TaxID=2014871 RepID=A0A401ZVC4_9CHLR|nr:tryptophan-rich sensory protein [Tengunoibacter tsumagoiensis]GCE10865.1 hypothetical protein KTT_07240 [Tengunoibacter tsumagoiensis]